MVSRFMGEQKYFQGFVEEWSVDEDQIEMRFVVPHIEYFARWLLMYGDAVMIIQSEELKEIITGLVQKLVEHHQILENHQQ